MRISRFEPWPHADYAYRNFGRPAARKAPDTWVPAVDIIEEKERILLRADVPGVSRDDIDLSLDNAVLTISGVRKATARGEDSEIRHSERVTGSFSRQFTLPETADGEHVSASIDNGILEIVVPKLPVAVPRRITIEAA